MLRGEPWKGLGQGREGLHQGFSKYPLLGCMWRGGLLGVGVAPRAGAGPQMSGLDPSVAWGRGAGGSSGG